MTKFYALIAACAVFAPMAMATLNQAAQIVALAPSDKRSFEKGAEASASAPFLRLWPRDLDFQPAKLGAAKAQFGAGGVGEVRCDGET